MHAYVLDGEPAAVLEDLKQYPWVGKTMGATLYPSSGQTRLYEEFDAIPVANRLRWARLLEAAAFHHHNQCVMRFPGDAHWPDVLLRHAAGSTVNDWSVRGQGQALSMAAFEGLLTEAGLPATALLHSAFASPVSGANRGDLKLQMVCG